MRIVIVGPGALGSVVAAALHQSGHDVTLLGRGSGGESPAAASYRLERMDGGVELIPLAVKRDPTLVATAELVIVLVKSGDTSAAARAIAPWLQPGQPILTLQNGLGNAERIRTGVVGGPMVLQGVTSLAATRIAPDLVRHAGVGPTLIGYTSAAESVAAHEIAALFTSAGLPAAAVADIERWIWRKLAINAAINGLTALAATPNGAVAFDAAMLDAAEIIAEEVAAVARAYGWEIGSMRAAVAETALATAANRSSMLQDLEAGRLTEIGAIHEAVLAAGRQVGIATPAVAVLTALIRARERSGRTENRESRIEKGVHD